MKDPYKIIKNATVTEKSMNQLYAELPIRAKLVIKHNKLTFLVHPKATKREIKWAVEKLFSVKVEKVNVLHGLRGKKAIVKLAKGYSAEEVGSRVGVF